MFHKLSISFLSLIVWAWFQTFKWFLDGFGSCRARRFYISKYCSTQFILIFDSWKRGFLTCFGYVSFEPLTSHRWNSQFILIFDEWKRGFDLFRLRILQNLVAPPVECSVYLDFRWMKKRIVYLLRLRILDLPPINVGMFYCMKSFRCIILFLSLFLYEPIHIRLLLVLL